MQKAEEINVGSRSNERGLSQLSWPYNGNSSLEHPRGLPSFTATLLLPLVAALVFGALIVFAEQNAIAVSIALLASIFIMLDFRRGVVCLIVLMPLSASALFPHSIGGITGLNPLNMLLAATFASLLLNGNAAGTRAHFATKPLVWLYIAPLVLAGAMGSQHIGEVSAEMIEISPGQFNSVGSYLINVVLKPLMLVCFALLVAAAAARSKNPERLIVPMLISISAMCMMTIAFVFLSGASLAELASSGARTFLSPLGIHANDLGRMYAVAYALMLFTFAASKDAGLRLLLAASMVLVVIALTLTFSRGAFFGFAVVNILFLISRRQLMTLVLGALLLGGLVILLPGAVFDRIGSGWGSDINVISAGRVDDIWLPVLPELWRHPFFGNGLSSIAWSGAMRNGTMLAVGHAHNAYLGAALDAGFIGLGLICAYFLHIWKGFRHMSTNPAVPPVLQGFYGGAAAGLVSFLLAAFFGSSLTPAIEQIFLWLAIGMMYGQHRTTAKGTPC